MSASSKKKLRKEENAQVLTERQAMEQKEAKKLKIYSIIFGVVISAMLIFALVFGVSKSVSNSGILERKTVAAVVGDHEISSAELNMFYIEAVNTFYNQYGSYAYLFGLDTTVALDEQVTNEETGATWADDFLDSALENLKFVYSICDLANAEGYTLSEKEQADLDSSIENAAFYALYYYGYSDLSSYLKAMYGSGCTEELYRQYVQNVTLAQSYYNNYVSSLTYEDADIRAYEADAYDEYSFYTYNYYTLSTSKFLTGGTTDEEGVVTYSDEEKAASVAAAEEAAKLLTSGEITTSADLDAAIAALEINADVEGAASTACTDYTYSYVSSTIRDWVTDSSRKAGDLTYIANTTTSTDEEGNETTTTSSYTVVLFGSRNDNEFPLVNVRHILVPYEGGTTDDDGNTTYSEDEMLAAEATAKDLLAQYESKGATREVFAELAEANSTDTGSNENGGLYTNVYPGQMVTNFNDWCFDESRQVGDTGLVQSDYGWHVMYFDGESDITYRDYMITEDMREEDTEAWYDSMLESIDLTVKNTRYINTDLVISSN